jgi:NAD(P)H-flavin reductase
MQAILKDKGDETEVALLYANQSPDDILLHAELQRMAAHPRVKVWFTGALRMPLLLCMHFCMRHSS